MGRKRTTGEGPIATLLDTTGWTLLQLSFQVGASERVLARWKAEGGISSPAAACHESLVALLDAHGISHTARARNTPPREPNRWEGADWTLNNVELARLFNVSRERARLARLRYAPPALSKSPRKGKTKP